MRMRWMAPLFVLVVCAAASAQEIDIPFQRFVLSNGLTVIVHEDHKAPIVAVNLWYHVGSKNEKPGKTGFAHLFEHLMFGGSQHAPGSYIQAMERVGATDLNGTTNNDRTNFFEDVPTSALDYALWMESDRMQYLDLSQKTLDLQRGVVQNEKRQDENEPYQLTEEYFPENTFPLGHPYSWSVIGEMSDLDAASFADVQEWFKTYYGPSNAVIVLAGDIDLKTAKEKVEKYFGNIPPGPPVVHQQAWIAKMNGTHREVTQERVPLGRIYKVWNVPQFGSADSDYLDLVSAVLGSGKTSRLYKRLVYDDQIASDVTIYNDSREIGGQFVIQVTARNGHTAAELENPIDEEMARFLKEGPTQDEMERVRTEYLAAIVRGLQRIGGFGGQSDLLAQFEVFTGDANNYKVTLKRIQDATADDVKAAAVRWLTDGQLVAEVNPFPDYAAGTGAAVDRSKPPAVGAATDAKLPKLERTTLPNGLKVILAARLGSRLVNAWLTADAGFAADQFATPGTTLLMTTLMRDGTSTRSALQISDEATKLGAELTTISGLDLSYVRLSALKAKLDPSLDLWADVILNPSFPEADFKREQKLQLDGIQAEQDEPFAAAERVMSRAIYGTASAYGNPPSGSGTTASVQKITRDDLVKFYDTWFRPNNCTVIITGDTTLAEIMPKLEKLFGNWKQGTVPAKKLPPANLPAKATVYIVDKPGAGQSMLVAGLVTVPPNTPNEIAIEAMNDAFGGQFGARLNMNLREDKHWTYGAQSLAMGARGQREYLAVAPVQSDKTKESLVEMNKELRAILADRPISADELTHVQEDEILKLPGSMETLDSVSTDIGSLLRFQWPDNYFDTMPAKIRALTTNDVNAAAKQVIHPDNLTWVIVGDRAKIEAGVRELNLGEIKHVDADGNPVQ
jgi:zinc protease